MRAVFLVVGAALALSACSGRYGTPPLRRPGLWQETIARDGGKTRLGMINGPIRLCVGPLTEARSPIFNYDTALKVAQVHHCRHPVAKRSLDGVYSFASFCELPGSNGEMSTQGTVTGDFKSTYHLRLQVDITRPPGFTALNSHHVDDIDGQWLGPCPSGMAPGDMMLANGLKLPGGRMQNPHQGASPAVPLNRTPPSVPPSKPTS